MSTMLPRARKLHHGRRCQEALGHDRQVHAQIELVIGAEMTDVIGNNVVLFSPSCTMWEKRIGLASR